VPPETVELKLTAVLTVPVVGPVSTRRMGNGATLTSWKTVFPTAVGVVESVTVRVTLYVPLTANVVENVDAVPVAGLPPVTAHAYLYGAAPPDTVDVKLTAVFTVPVVGPLMLTVRGAAPGETNWSTRPTS
jgi:hypothetical protein